MNRAQTRAFLSHLCALLPHTAPHVLDPELVRRWHESVTHDLSGDLAFEVADQLAVIHEAPTFPTCAAFSQIRRQSWLIERGAIDTFRTGLIAARAALTGTDEDPEEDQAA